MSDVEVKRGIGRWLEAQGFDVREIPTDSRPTADLLVTKDHRFLIEIKTRNEDPQVTAARKDSLASEEPVIEGMPFIPQDRIAEIIKFGVKQLGTYPATERDFCLLWILTGGPDTVGQYEQVRATLYGLSGLVGTDSPDRIECYDFRHSGFHRHREILDGAILCEGEACKLLLNSHSPRARNLATSSLGSLFASAIEDPDRRERDGLAYIADCEADRSNEAAVLECVKQKYARENLMPFNIGTMVGYIGHPERR